jgi:glycerol uptake facilitator-like aquaporin
VPFDGCSLNPARSLGPDLVGNTWHSLWAFLLAPLLGGGLAWLIHSRVVAGVNASATS